MSFKLQGHYGVSLQISRVERDRLMTIGRISSAKSETQGVICENNQAPIWGRRRISRFLNKVSLTMKVLHENGLVFGDLRSPNNPADINLEDIEWPEGVAPGRLLQLKHDDGMFRKLKERRSFTNIL